MSDITNKDNNITYFGVVIWFKGNLGFLEWLKDGVKQKDMFVYYADIDAEGFRMLRKGQQVSFQIGTNHSGLPKAIHVKVLNPTK